MKETGESLGSCFGPNPAFKSLVFVPVVEIGGPRIRAPVTSDRLKSSAGVWRSLGDPDLVEQQFFGPLTLKRDPVA